SDVAERRRTQERVNDGVQKRISVGMSLEPRLGRKNYSSQHQAAFAAKRMAVKTESHLMAGFSHEINAQQIRRSFRVVTLMLVADPSTTCTGYPLRSASSASSVAVTEGRSRQSR